MAIQLSVIFQRVAKPRSSGVLVRDEEEIKAVVGLGHKVEERPVGIGVEVADDGHLHPVLDEPVEDPAREPGRRVPELGRERLLVDGDEVRAALRLDAHEELVGGVLILEQYVVRIDDGNVEALDGLHVDHSHRECAFLF